MSINSYDILSIKRLPFTQEYGGHNVTVNDSGEVLFTADEVPALIYIINAAAQHYTATGVLCGNTFTPIQLAPLAPGLDLLLDIYDTLFSALAASRRFA